MTTQQLLPQVASDGLPPALTSSTVPSGILRRNRWHGFLAIRRLRDGFWLNVEPLHPDEPLWGPYGTRGDAEEAARSYLRNATSKPWLKDGWPGPGRVKQRRRISRRKVAVRSKKVRR
jgi:hypothetical protein